MSLAATERYRQVAALHAASIDQGFLATLGVPFLALMYEAIDLAEDSVLLTEEQDGRILGFVAGGLGMGPIYRSMLRSPLRLTWALLPSLLRPRRVMRILDILHYGRRQGDGARWPKAELLSIAVAGAPLLQAYGRNSGRPYRGACGRTVDGVRARGKARSVMFAPRRTRRCANSTSGSSSQRPWRCTTNFCRNDVYVAILGTCRDIGYACVATMNRDHVAHSCVP